MKQTGRELINKASAEDAATLKAQLNEIDSLWNRTSKLSERRSNRLLEALKDVSATLIEAILQFFNILSYTGFVLKTKM